MEHRRAPKSRQDALLLRPLRIYWVLLCKNCVAVRESEARAGCNCDLGDTLMHRVSTRKNQTKADAPIFPPVKQRGKYLEYHPPPARVRRSRRQ